ncbi:MAG: hypothetical protein A2W52_03780 [Candidatus Taylorbacteria bacterium RIFCSPHIGHO2_02_49_25]|uniref:Uncharacterized protein n=1 Tax=Candidatus Taylorbacteria bacterium RIFCSPHIGHO2_02_49_25 TaxID=1802305 RepID=A0A1G2MHR7_9BACT|nr:MAG: hypothetical protein A2W52_03780 [Candidatus Taylorbacteria bacterium RIFCSPHIGHO2_02_49_25]OHA36737.1 MAG: hypothetical protein A2W65_01905 [Candidatus Taylorbacteria bacterium RIFCSPLOWO2_02_50_13]OHA42534.1 MAG: hypothetical protein A3H73_04075 [Candidatus Taylorbacteria bacterium RIFCSPLOWO2_02_FULL_50_120]OHA47806.1 MAG: hypothetical protein A3G61_03305 [Candidatus Taylorbacteria bacterium RIFCSPLOWO2_12_FULL_49_67]HCB35829.1 hypothetical protein [Candidatus Taylorbacteria bacteriu
MLGGKNEEKYSYEKKSKEKTVTKTYASAKTRFTARQSARVRPHNERNPSKLHGSSSQGCTGKYSIARVVVPAQQMEDLKYIPPFLTKFIKAVETECQLSSFVTNERIMLQSDPASNGGVLEAES